jgi:hypothetical protein
MAGRLSDPLSQPSSLNRSEARLGHSLRTINSAGDEKESVLHKTAASNESRCVDIALYYRHSRTSDLPHSGHGLSNSAIG